MPGCFAPGCPSRQGTPGVNLHRLPKDIKLRAVWMKRIRRADQPADLDAVRLCSTHFTAADFEIDLRQHLLGK